MKKHTVLGLAGLLLLAASHLSFAGNCPYEHEIVANGQGGWKVIAAGWRVKSYSAPAYSSDKAVWDNHASAVSVNGGYGISCDYSYGPSFDKLSLESTIIMENPDFSRAWTGTTMNKDCYKRIEQCTW